MEDEYTTISIKRKTKERFEKLGNLATNVDGVLNSLLDFWYKYKDVVDQKK